MATPRMTQTFKLLPELFGDGGMADVFSAESTVSAWLRVEAALARAQADAGVLAESEAEAIAGACVLTNIDMERLWREAVNVGYPILPLVRMIAAALPEGPNGRVHYGATTQDIMDSALSLQMGEALDRLLVLLGEFGDALARLVEEHAGTVIAARTHAQQAVPTTFGAKIAVLLAEVTRQRERLRAAARTVRIVSLFGAGGTSAALGAQAATVRKGMAVRLGLRTTDVPWHVARDGVVEFGVACAGVTATAARFALSGCQYIDTAPWPSSCIGRMRIAFNCSKRRAARCDATPSRSVLFSSVRFRIDEFDSTQCGGCTRPAAVSATCSALCTGVPGGQTIHE